MRIIAFKSEYDKGAVCIQESAGGRVRNANIGALVAFLLESYAASDWAPQYDKCIRVAWDLDAFVAPILRLIGKAKCERLARTHKVSIYPFQLFYIPTKMFSVKGAIRISDRWEKGEATFYSLNQFFPELDALDNLDEVQMLGEKLMYELKKMVMERGANGKRVGMEPSRLVSPVAIFTETVLDFLDLPGLGDMPKEAAIFSEGSTDEWIENYTVGYINEAWDYDLASAYGMEARELVDFRKGQWVRSNQYQVTALMGFARCIVEIYPGVFLSPILFRNPEGKLESRTGTFERYCTKEQLRFISRWKIGKAKILDGIWLLPPKGLKGSLPKPLKTPVDRLLAYKQTTGLQKALAKRCMMFSGKFSEKHDDPLKPFGKYYCPPWKAVINNNVSLKVAEFLYRLGIGPGDNEGYKHLMHISLDGVLLDKPVDLIAPQWRLTYQGPALCISSGNVYYADKRPSGLTLQETLAMIKEHPNQGYYDRMVKRRVTLAEVLALDKFDDLGKERDMEISLDLYTMQHDRRFPRLPRTGGALLKRKYHSQPLTINQVAP